MLTSGDAATVALGSAFGRMSAECAANAQQLLLERRWVGRPPSEDFLESRHHTLLISNLLVARWLIAGEAMNRDEVAWLEQRGRLAAAEHLSIVNVTRSYLVWRDTAIACLDAQAEELGTPADVLEAARRSVRAAADAAVIRMARTYDEETERLRDQLAAEREAFRHAALHDPLTGLPNRVLLHDRLQQAIITGRRHQRMVVLLMIDLDEFKQVNDLHGHDTGDAVLRRVARCLESSVRSSDTVARLGGDEFAVVLPDCGTRQAADQIAATIAARLKEPFELMGVAGLAVGASVGVACFPADGADGDALLSAADMAMYRSKRTR